jgi:hypothetical protein
MPLRHNLVQQTRRGDPSSKEFEHLLRDFYFRLEERDRWADQAIKYLLSGNGGGVALLMTYIGVLGRAGEHVPILLIPLLLFLAGIVFVGMVVLVSMSKVRHGRRGVRKLISAYLAKEKSYRDAFVEMGTWPSKWKHSSGFMWASFSAFIAGIVASAAIYAVLPTVSRPQAIATTQVQAGAIVGNHTPTVARAVAPPTRRLSNGQHPAQVAATPSTRAP